MSRGRLMVGSTYAASSPPPDIYIFGLALAIVAIAYSINWASATTAIGSSYAVTKIKSLGLTVAESWSVTFTLLKRSSCTFEDVLPTYKYSSCCGWYLAQKRIVQYLAEPTRGKVLIKWRWEHKLCVLPSICAPPDKVIEYISGTAVYPRMFSDGCYCDSYGLGFFDYVTTRGACR